MQNYWFGFASTITILVLGFSFWNSYKTAKSEGAKASQEIKEDFDKLKKEIEITQTQSKESFQKTKDETEDVLKQSKSILLSLTSTDSTDTVNNEPLL